jgi:hypothetical protein
VQSETNRVTSTLVEELVANLNAAGIDSTQATRGQICRVAGVSDRRARTLQAYLRPVVLSQTEESAPLTVTLPTASVAETQEVKGDSWTISLPKTRIKTLPELLEHCKVDESEWTVERFVVNKWEMGSNSKEPTELFQVKAWLKRRSDMVAVKAEIESLKEELRLGPFIEFNQPPEYRQSRTGYMLEVNIPDIHVGKLAWGEETLGDNYDVKLAIKAYEDALVALIERTSSYQFDKVLFVCGNDALNQDNKRNTTTAGTPQDCDGRFQKNYVLVRQMTTAAIHRLKQVAPVDVVIVPGNHDETAAFCLGDSIQCVFEKDPNVTVDNRASLRKYYQWNKVMLLLTHGNQGKSQDGPLLMATEQPVMFGSTVHREIHTGHLHQTRVTEYHGIKVRILPALCPSDAWHANNAYTGNARSAEAFVWHGIEGLVGTANYTVPK